MKDLELFEKWCELEIEAQEVRRNIEISENVPKWKQLQRFGDSNAPDCYSAIKVIKLFKYMELHKEFLPCLLVLKER
jgi:hypothetical protein